MNCFLCGSEMQRLLDLPKFPITEKYEPWTKTFVEGRGVVDQSFNYCEACSHGQLGTVVSGLYDSDYRTRTSLSDGARQAVSRFYYFIHNNCEKRGTHIDIGGNDGEMGKYFPGVIVVDPHAVGGIRSTIEQADLSSFKNEPKIIMSSHTIEHLADPEIMIAKCSEIMRDDDYLALQFPSMELLVEDGRIDQIHHQHIHYFSQSSISQLLARHGLSVKALAFDYQHWGAIMLVAQKNGKVSDGPKVPAYKFAWQADDFVYRMRRMKIPEGYIALGAALMLPVLAYWMPELQNVAEICDDDANKNGLRYINFNKRITNDYGLYGKDVVITAIGTKEATRKLTNKAIEAWARRIILPLSTI